MLQICLAHRKAIDHIVIQETDISKYKITEEEWDHIQELSVLLKTFNDSHLMIRSSSTISAPKVLMTFHKIKSVVENHRPGNPK